MTKPVADRLESIATEAEAAYTAACGQARSATDLPGIHEAWCACERALGRLLAEGAQIAGADPAATARLVRVRRLRDAAVARMELHG